MDTTSTHTTTTTLQAKIQELLHARIRAHDVKENDAVSLKTLKLFLVGEVIESLGLNWDYILNLFKNHTPVHPDIARVLMTAGCDDDVTNALAQRFVRSQKLGGMMKTLIQQHGFSNMNKILAVDGLLGNGSPSFEPKHYVTNLRYGDTRNIFDTEPECRRLHVLTVRKMYDMLEKVPAPEKNVYKILRMCFDEMARVLLPELDMKDEDTISNKLEDQCGKMYMKAMGKENIQALAKILKLSPRGEKRTASERDDDD